MLCHLALKVSEKRLHALDSTEDPFALRPGIPDQGSIGSVEAMKGVETRLFPVQDARS